MILKKPYAFIIRHFRLFNLSILACLFYLFLNSRSLYSFFASLQSTGTYTYVGASSYINTFVYTIGIIGILLCGVLYYLFKFKKKNYKFYFYTIIYILVIFISYYFLYGKCNGLETTIYKIDDIILYKDIALISFLPAIYFMVVLGIRGIGFNIKKFNFSKDLEELQIVDKDSAEFEVLIGQNNYKYLRTARRTVRELKYYILENKLAITLVSIVVLIVLGIVGFLYYQRYEKRMAEFESSMVNGITYTVTSSYVTENDYNGVKIRNGFKYVIVNLDLYTSIEDKVLPLESIFLGNGELKYSPTLSYNGKFYDLGVPYPKDVKLIPNEINNYSLVFEIPSSVKTNTFTLKVHYGIDDTFTDSIVVRYKNFKIKADKIDQGEDPIIIKLNDEMKPNVVSHNEFNLSITNYEINDSYIDSYVVCYNLDTCDTLLNPISSTNKDATQTLLVLSYKGYMSDNAYFTKKFNDFNKISENFITVNYVVEGKLYQEKARVVANNDIDGKIFILVNRKIKKANKIYLMFDYRNTKYKLMLKGE